ncbi:MAG: MogA/MoaB family molybdenum cofactor biosynthesis protein [Dorea sp.]|nr:MogA/MoaB family molybdenum cofactor biosynthesis protein [uncultured Dorea sp.]
MKVAIITANTDIYKGVKENESGEAAKLVVEEAGLEVVFLRALPLDREVLSTVMKRMVDEKAADLILTTGGAGCNPGDCTPEATMDIVDRPVPGIPEAMRAHTMKLTRRSMLNRSTAGISGDVLIVNLPGKAQAVKESLRFLLPEIVHAVNIIKGEA